MTKNSKLDLERRTNFKIRPKMTLTLKFKQQFKAELSLEKVPEHLC